VRVLPDWDLPASTGWAVFPGRRLMPAKTRAFLDMMEEMCGPEAARP
jgi:DNA-binding transcriptional LysR family regulator